MIDHVFTRLGSQFREGAILHCKFVTAAGPVFAAKSSRAGSFHKRVSLVKDTSTGFLKLTLDGGAREIAVLAADHVNLANPTDATLFLDLKQYAAIDEGNGIVKFKSITRANPQAFADAQTTDEIHITLYVAK